ncbi:hypothetical protein LTR67_009456 [Exophiala xenobiotica]
MSMSVEKNSDTPAAEEVERYSVFTPSEKWCIVAMVSCAAWFSTLSSFIYYPALHSIAQALSVSVAKVNLTVTSYLAVATIAPTLLGDAADTIGRRPVYLIVLGLYFVANISIALSESYDALLGLRLLQAAAISGTFSIAYGVLTDIASSAERGSFVGAVSFALGPILGGSLTYAAGWTWIFWFLAIASGLCSSVMLCFLPETARNIVGNGSVTPPKYLRLPIPTSWMCHWQDSNDAASRTRRIPNPLTSVMILFRRDNATIIFACGLL